MGDHRLPKIIMSGPLGTLDNVGRGARGRFGQTARQRIISHHRGLECTAALDPGAWYKTGCNGCCRFFRPRGQGKRKRLPKTDK